MIKGRKWIWFDDGATDQGGCVSDWARRIRGETCESYVKETEGDICFTKN